MKTVGRQRERETLRDAARPDKAALVAIYGRRRVGKTHLVRAEYERLGGTYFEVIGQHEAPKAIQLDNFRRELDAKLFDGRAPAPQSWRQALSLLADGVERAAKRCPNKPVVVFFDELPWMSTHRSGLLPAIDHVWNARLSKVNNLVWVLCGSAASFMLDRLINAKGGLHNRITHRIRLEPFRLGEARDLLRAKGIRRSTAHVLELYMALGGVPYYLQHVPRGTSAAQAVGQLCFDPAGQLSDEFDRLFASLFDDASEHERLVRAIAEKRGGMQRDELIAASSLPSGGRLTKRIAELEAAGFLARFTPYRRKSRDTSYRLIDEYVSFHLTWIDTTPRGGFGRDGSKYWLSRRNTPRYAAWAGNTFEGICLKHASAIERALGIDGMANEVGSWRYVPKRGVNEGGAQIDLLFDRPDGVINLCELKYASQDFVLTKPYAKHLVTRAEIFKERTKTKKDVVTTLVTTHGLARGLWNDEVIDGVVTADDLLD